jgi:hypothetical protein
MNPLSHAKKAVETHPAKITAKEFLEMVAENPSVFEHWETPLEIIGYVNCKHSPITHLSQYLTFSEPQNGNSASFEDCENLKIATGTFHGWISFNRSGIEKIEKLHVIKDNKGASASFYQCKSLQIATGNYAGFVDFLESGIHSIQNLHIENPDEDGHYASFENCPNLKNLEGWDLSKEILNTPRKLKAEKKRRAALKKYHKETQVESLPFL